MKSQVDPDAGTRNFTYDDVARTTTRTDPGMEQSLTQSYDTLGRLIGKTSGVGTVTLAYGESRSGYKNWGRLTTVNAPGTKQQFDYDAAGNVKKQSRTISSAGYDKAVVKQYDAAGRLTGLTYPDGDSIGPFGYDEAGRLTTIPGILNDVTYDAAGRPLVQTNANNTVTTRTYVPQRGLLSTQMTTSPAVVGGVQSLTYAYDDQLPLVTSVTSSSAGESWTYEYDDGYRLTKSTNLTSSSDSQTFAYDSLGRMTSNSRVGPGPYVYPADGQPRPHAPTSVNGSTYTYYANGNLKAGGGRTPTWDAESRLSAIGTATFSYDGFGERIKKTSSQGTSLYPFGDDHEITKGIITRYISVDGLGVIAKRVGTGTSLRTYWLHTDRLGSINAITSDGNGQPAGSLVFRRDYRPYGETRAQSGTHTESRGWIDQRNDSETGLTYLHARYFDPKLGTFLSPDPVGVEGGMDLYAYGFGDPINGSDRSGLDWVPCEQGSCWDGGWGTTVDATGPSTPSTPSNPLPGGAFPGGDIGNVFEENTGNTAVGGDSTAAKKPAHSQTRDTLSSGLVKVFRKIGSKISFTVEGGGFGGPGGNGLLTFGPDGFGFCMQPGLGVGGELDFSPDSRLPKTGLVVSAKAGFSSTLSGGGAVQVTVAGDPVGAPLTPAQGAVETQWQRPLGGEQYTKDVSTGEVRVSANIGADYQARVSAGVCIAVGF